MKTKQTVKEIKNEKILTQQLELRNKRRELILKVLGQLIKGQIGNLLFRKGLIYKINYYKNYNDEEKRQLNALYIYSDFNELKEELLKNIHDISKKLNEENLSILEFLMNNMDMTWETTKKDLKDIEINIQEIKNKCANYLLLMQIEESEW